MIRVFHYLVLSFIALWPFGAGAVDVSQPLPILPAKVVLSGNSSHFHADFDKGIEGECEPLLKRLEKALVRGEDSEYAARVVYGEMYDRAICVPYDPAKAFENFKRAADMGGLYRAVQK